MNRDRIALVVVGLLLAASWGYAQEIIWYRDGRGNLTGQYVQVAPGESLSVTFSESVSVDSPIAVTGTFSESVSVDSPIAVTATDLDIRALTALTDSVDVSATALDIRALTALTDSVDVSATALDIRALSSATDSVDVSATALDIRALSSATDSVEVVQPAAVGYDEVVTNLTLSNIETAYSHDLPVGATWYEVQARTAHAFRYARAEDDLLTAYRTVAAGEALRVPVIPSGKYSGTLWFRTDSEAGLVLEIRVGCEGT